ncbi:Major facilitator superfamily domain general substrate transporter [Penicillium macrosclerotiorum]|uniref:Major facilitator superfamily domain general substrate transporter n=1 Tax=Penicillium macrosclerotiorum TaxID=303699 RepID=UPI0025493E18|nr:Major facilitator superfamily domain general substrate transporter [Penicillium macrosclerotiorum]KAJ5690651.1 Major facilitator superfamily domain general substrate transporter [Penicillium macrosclerotiorum]
MHMVLAPNRCVLRGRWACVGLGILVIFMQGLNYIIDVYMMFANSAIAANTLIRSIAGGAFPLFANQMYQNLGVNWESSLLGFITAAMIPVPILFSVYGAKIRVMSGFLPSSKRCIIFDESVLKYPGHEF